MRKNKYLMAGILFLVISFVLVRAQTHRQQRERSGADQIVLRDVVMAKQTVPKWTVITPEMIEIQQIDPSKEVIPQDALRSLDDVRGKVTRAEVMPGRPIAAGELLAQQELGLSAQLPPGKRAMTIQVSDTTSVAGFLRPGDRVDVLGTFTGEAPVTDTLLQGVLVIAVGKVLEQKSLNAVEPSNLVTIAVTPSEARTLTFAQTKATIQLVLRPIAEAPMLIEPSAPPVPKESVRIVQHSARPRASRSVQTQASRSPTRRPQRQASFPGMSLGPPPPLPPAKPELVIPIPPPVPPRPTAARTVSEGPAQPTAAPPRTVEVIRGTQRETVTLRVTEGKGTNDEPSQDQR